MKAIKTIILLLICTNLSYGQAYETLFGSESTQWNMTVGNLWGVGSTKHKIIGDTVIDGLSYKIIDGYILDEELYGYLRVDSLNQRAWYRNNQSDEEHLVMDLSLQVGDSLFIQGAWNGNHKYYMVDSVYTKDNRKHIQFDLSIEFFQKEQFTLIESVVSNMGFRYQDNDYANSFPTILLCAYHNEEMIYGEGECVINSIEETKTTSDVNLYPNPVVDKLNVRLNESITDGKIEVISQIGEVKQHKSGKLLSTEIIDLNGMNRGIYFIRISNYENGVIQTHKIVKSE